MASEVGRPISLGYLAEIAAAYVDAWKAGSRTPTAAVADRLALEEGVIREPSTIERLVRRARKEGLLGPAPSGKAGGELTQRALDLLEERAEDRERYRQRHSWIWMTHPSFPDREPVRATEAAFRVWKKRGWKKLGPADAPPGVVSPKQRGRA